MENAISKLKEVLFKKGFTEKHPFQLPLGRVFIFHLRTYGNLKINAKYIYIKGGVPFIATHSYDEIAVECLSQDDIDSLISLL